MSLKPCIECGRECEILPIQLGDLFTLCYVRLCGAECLFLFAYDFMRDKCVHYEFRAKLCNIQNEEDKKERDDYVNEVTDESLRMMTLSFKENPLLLSLPVPDTTTEMFKSKCEIPQSCGKTMRFTRPSLQDRITWAKEHVERMKESLFKAVSDLERLQNE